MPRAFSLFEGTTFNAATLVVAAVGVVVAVAGAFLAWRALFPSKRRLVFVERSVASMLSDASHRMTGVAVTRNGETLDDPHIVVFAVENTGRHAVTSDHFDQDRPIVVDLGVPVIEVISSSYRRKSGSVDLKCTANGTTVSLGPDLFPRRSELLVQVMTAGRPALVSVDDRLVDTTVVKIENGADGRARRVSVAAKLGVALSGTLVILIIVALGQLVRDLPPAFAGVKPEQGKDYVEEGAKITVGGFGFRDGERLRCSITDTGGRVYLQNQEVRAEPSGDLNSQLQLPQLDDVGRTGAALAKLLVLDLVREDGSKVTARFVVVGI